ncbi:ADP-ribosylglycohydrolase family protein [Knoellia sp. CPCC 206450]|uniref:ADP-ribosylglycohydrolase family protein n=1 Tax=Knoellia tibetensis TaxID=3404798 RepID=UPI003B434748
MNIDRAEVESWENGIRGMMLGLALGESFGRGLHPHPSRVIRAGVSTQLAAFTTEGLIRAMVRMSHKGICSPPDVIWQAYRRWAKGQGISIAPTVSDAAMAGEADGWLKDVSALRERRGSSPSTVTALQSGHPGTPERPTNQSMGCQGLTRVLPLAVLAFQGRTDQAVDLARRVTALSHGSPVGLGVTAAGIAVAAHCIRCDDAQDGLHEGANATHHLGLPTSVSNQYLAVLGLEYGKGSLPRLREIAPDKTSRSALLGGMYVASTYPHPHQFTEALAFAAQAPDGDSVGAVTGALLGASHGASQLPVDLVSRHELAWVLDTLARDAVLELTDSPGGSDYETPRDRHWLTRYPGW